MTYKSLSFFNCTDQCNGDHIVGRRNHKVHVFIAYCPFLLNLYILCNYFVNSIKMYMHISTLICSELSLLLLIVLHLIVNTIVYC